MQVTAEKLIRDFTPTLVVLETQRQDEEDILETLAESLDMTELQPVADLYGQDAAEILLHLVEEVGFAISDAQDNAKRNN